MFSTISSGLLSRLAWQKQTRPSATLNSLNDAIAMIEFTPDGIILNANPLFLDRMGYALSDIVGQHHSLFCTAEFAQSAHYRDFWLRLKRASERRIQNVLGKAQPRRVYLRSVPAGK